MVIMRLFSLFLCSVFVAAQENDTVVPTIPPTDEPTTTFPPTGTPTKSPVPAPVPKRACYSDLVEVEDLVKLKDPFIDEKYVLCPNTVYQMGTVDPVSFEIVDGFPPIVTRSHSIYLCGEDGKSSNNCVITGGEYHLFHEYNSYNKENKVNIVIKGLTFENANGAGILAAAPGDITFVDCIFRNHQNTGVLSLLYSYDDTRRLTTTGMLHEKTGKVGRLIKYYSKILNDPVALETLKDDATRSHERRLQAGEIIDAQTVTLDGCLFENNNHGPDSSLTIDGMIFLNGRSNSLIAKNSIFRNNNFTNPINGGNGYAISGVPGAAISISDVCFLDNYFIGSGVVVIEGTTEDFTSTNVYGTIDPKLVCPYASINDETCLPYDRGSCSVSNNFNNATPVAALSGSGSPISVGGGSIENTTDDAQRTSGCLSINSMYLVVLIMSVAVAL